MLKGAPNVAAAHFEPGDGPTECVHLVAQDFWSLMLAVTTTMPTYHDWLLFTDSSILTASSARINHATPNESSSKKAPMIA
jgi:hypothetical protein